MKRRISDRFVSINAYIITGVFAVVCILPLWMAICASFTNEMELLRGGYKLWIPEFDLTSYKLIFTGTSVMYKAYFVTISMTVIGTLLMVLFTALTAYPLSVKKLKYSGGISFYIYITMLVNGGLVPTYILVTRVLHMKNSFWALVIPGLLQAYNIFLMKSYFKSIPSSLAESAKIDGASHLKIFINIIIPLSKPILATIGLFGAMGYWNEWYRVLLYIDNPDLYTLQYLIMKMQRQLDFLTSEMGSKALRSMGNTILPSLGIRMATAMLSIGPIVIVYPLLQKYFMKGIMIGSVKE
ncbi:MAG: carbohydrate ABC transporter permease [Vallitaleaceae bacterium]|nr:carbohydrate ABC transporter permease [Vallitaleaceae bacterium]